MRRIKLTQHPCKTISGEHHFIMMVENIKKYVPDGSFYFIEDPIYLNGKLAYKCVVCGLVDDDGIAEKMPED